jgi:hypothetical protein
MPLNNNFFVEGIDPTATFGGFASVLLQLVRQATPSSTYGMVLFDSSPPYVLAPYAWRKRCVWINTTNINLPTLWVYREGGSPGWYDVTASIPASSITSAMLQNSIVTLAKLSASGAAANQLIQVNATATGFQFVNPFSLFATPSTIPLSAIIATPVSPATYGIPVSYGGAAATWELPVDLATFFPDQSFTVAQLLRSPTVSAIAKFPRSSTASPVVVWGPLVPATDIVDNGVNGLKITDETLPITKILPHTVDGYYLTTTSGTPTWTVIPVSTTTVKYVDTLVQTLTQNLPAYGVTLSIAHPLGQMPTTYRVALYCAAPTVGQTYIIGDEIDLATVNQGQLGDWWTAFNVRLTSAAVVLRRFASPAAIQIPDKTTGGDIYITETNWRLRLYATYTS